MQVNDVNEHQEKNEQGRIVHRIYLLQTKKKRELEIGKSKVLNHHLAAFRFDFIEWTISLDERFYWMNDFIELAIWLN